MSFRVSQQNNLENFISVTIPDGIRDAGELSHRTLRRIAGKYVSMTVAVRPASLWKHAMFATLAAMDKAGSSWAELRLDANANLLGEFKH